MAGAGARRKRKANDGLHSGKDKKIPEPGPGESSGATTRVKNGKSDVTVSLIESSYEGATSHSQQVPSSEVNNGLASNEQNNSLDISNDSDYSGVLSPFTQKIGDQSLMVSEAIHLHMSSTETNLANANKPVEDIDNNNSLNNVTNNNPKIKTKPKWAQIDLGMQPKIPINIHLVYVSSNVHKLSELNPKIIAKNIHRICGPADDIQKSKFGSLNDQNKITG